MVLMFNFWKYLSIFFLISATLFAVLGFMKSDSFFVKEAILIILVAYLAYKEYLQAERDHFFKGDPFHKRKRRKRF